MVELYKIVRDVIIVTIKYYLRDTCPFFINGNVIAIKYKF